MEEKAGRWLFLLLGLAVCTEAISLRGRLAVGDEDGGGEEAGDAGGAAEPAGPEDGGGGGGGGGIPGNRQLAPHLTAMPNGVSFFRTPIPACRKLIPTVTAAEPTDMTVRVWLRDCDVSISAPDILAARAQILAKMKPMPAAAPRVLPHSLTPAQDAKLVTSFDKPLRNMWPHNFPDSPKVDQVLTHMVQV